MYINVFINENKVNNYNVWIGWLLEKFVYIGIYKKNLVVFKGDVKFVFFNDN